MSKDKRPPAPELRRGQPPAQYRFKPGQSGNPKGRPKKERPAKLNPLEQAFQDAFIEEANRMITINEGGQQRTMPAHQAVIRATQVNALKGNAIAQRTLLQTGLEIERRVQKAHAERFVSALEKKIKLEYDLRRWMAKGGDGADLALHPDDIEIDPETLDVRTYFALTSDQVKNRREMVEARDALLMRIALYKEILVDELDENVRRTLEASVALLAQLNDALPPRLRSEVVPLDPTTSAQEALKPRGDLCVAPEGNAECNAQS